MALSSNVINKKSVLSSSNHPHCLQFKRPPLVFELCAQFIVLVVPHKFLLTPRTYLLLNMEGAIIHSLPVRLADELHFEHLGTKSQ